MHATPYPTHPRPEPALHLLGGIWIASCPTCGYQLVTARARRRSSGERPAGAAPSATRTVTFDGRNHDHLR